MLQQLSTVSAFVIFTSSSTRLEVPVQTGSFYSPSSPVQERTCDEWQVECVIWCGFVIQNHQCARFPPLPQAASRYYVYYSQVDVLRTSYSCLLTGDWCFVKQQQFDLFKFALPGQPLPPEMTLAQLLTLLYDRKQPQGYQSINLTVKLGSKVISDPGLSKTDSFKRLRTEKGTQTWSSTILLAFRCGVW